MPLAVQTLIAPIVAYIMLNPTGKNARRLCLPVSARTLATGHTSLQRLVMLDVVFLLTLASDSEWFLSVLYT